MLKVASYSRRQLLQLVKMAPQSMTQLLKTATRSLRVNALLNISIEIHGLDLTAASTTAEIPTQSQNDAQITTGERLGHDARDDYQQSSTTSALASQLSALETE